MKKNIKFITLVITAILLVGAVIGITASADDAQQIRIAGMNIAYEGAPQILYLVDTKYDLEDGETVKLVYSESAFDALAVGEKIPQTLTVKGAYTENGEIKKVIAGGREFYAFFSDSIAPQNSAKTVYACPVVLDADGVVTTVGAITEYDVRQYARNRFANEYTDAQKALYTSLLDYAASIQAVMYDEETINNNGGYADEYIATTFNKVLNGSIIEATTAYNRPGATLSTEKFVSTYGNFYGFTNENGEAMIDNGMASSWTTVTLDGNDVVVTVNAEYEFDKKYGYYYAYEDGAENYIHQNNRFYYSLDDVVGVWVSYMYKGTVYQYPTVTTDDAGNQTLTAGSESVLLYDATEQADKWITVEAYNALSDEEKATALVKIETLVSHNGDGNKVSYSETVDSYDGTKAVKITHAPFALEDSLAFKKGDVLTHQSSGALAKKYSAATIPASNSSVYYGSDKYFVFETDFKYVSYNATGHELQFGINSSVGTIFSIGVTNNDVSKGVFDLVSVGLNSEEKTEIREYIGMELKYGEWYNIRIEIVPDATAAQKVYANVYINGELIKVLTKTYQNKDASSIATDLKEVKIAMTSNASKEFTLDNTYVATEGTLQLTGAKYIPYNSVEEYDDSTLPNIDFGNCTNKFNDKRAESYTLIDSVHNDNVLAMGNVNNKKANTIVFKPTTNVGAKTKLVMETEFYFAPGSDVSSNDPKSSVWAFKIYPSNGDTSEAGSSNQNDTFVVSDKTFNSRSATGTTFKKGEWHVLRCEYDPSTNYWKVIIDGKQLCNKKITLKANTEINGFCIGARQASAFYFKNFEWQFDNTYCDWQYAPSEYAALAEDYNDLTDGQIAIQGWNDAKVDSSFAIGNSIPSTTGIYTSVVSEAGNKYLVHGLNGTKSGWYNIRYAPIVTKNVGDVEKVTYIAETDFMFDEPGNLVGDWTFSFGIRTSANKEVVNSTIEFTSANTYRFDNGETTAPAFKTGVWYNIRFVAESVTIDGATTTTCTIYVNGANVGTANVSASAGALTENDCFTIAWRSQATNHHTDAQIALDNTYVAVNVQTVAAE